MLAPLRLIIVIFIFSTFRLNGQKNHFNLVLGFGPSYFFNDKSLNRYVDHTLFMGVNYVVNVKNQPIGFNPGINIQKNAYHARMKGKSLVHVNQTMFNLNLDVLLKLRKKNLLKVGINFNSVVGSDAFIVLKDAAGKQYYGFSNEQVYKNYFPSDFQAGFNIGLCFPFKFFNREQRFDIKLSQSVSSIVDSDYYLDKAVAGEDVKVLSTKARPTQLFFALEINLQRLKKKKKETAEE